MKSQRDVSEPEKQGGQLWYPQLTLAKQGWRLSCGMEWGGGRGTQVGQSRRVRVAAAVPVLGTPGAVRTSVPVRTPKAAILAEAHSAPSAQRPPLRAALLWLRSGGPCSPCPRGFADLPLPPIAEEKKKLVEEKAVEMEEQNKVIAAEKTEAETALAEVMPILEAAKLELQKLDKSDVTEIR